MFQILEVMVDLSLELTKHLAMNIYVGMEV